MNGRGASTAPAGLLVVTDLDGCLLDETTYDFEAARPALERIREALKHDDETELKSALEELRGRWNEAAAKAYQTAESGAAGGPGAAGGEASGGGPPEEDVIEADYEVVDEEK